MWPMQRSFVEIQVALFSCLLSPMLRKSTTLTSETSFLWLPARRICKINKVQLTSEEYLCTYVHGGNVLLVGVSFL